MPFKPFKDSLAQGILKTNQNISGKPNPLGLNTPGTTRQPYEQKNFGSISIGAPIGGGAGGAQQGGAQQGGGIGGGAGGGIFDPDPPHPEDFGPNYQAPDIGGWYRPWGVNPDYVQDDDSGGGWDDSGEDWIQAEWMAGELLNQWSLSPGITQNEIESMIFDWMQGNIEGQQEGGVTELNDFTDWLVQNGFLSPQTGPSGIDIDEGWQGPIEGLKHKPGPTGGPPNQFSQARRGRSPFEMPGMGNQPGFAASGSFINRYLNKKEEEEI
jgi:hypothetical protein